MTHVPGVWTVLFAAAMAAIGSIGPAAPAEPNLILNDDFEDGDLADWTPGSAVDWTNSTTAPMTGARSLKHALTAVTGTSYVYATPAYHLDAGETVWRFTLRNGGWDPTAQNRFWVCLMADGSNLVDSALNGYAAGVNLTGSSDALSLWRIDADGSRTALIVSSLDWNASQGVGVEVVRTPAGHWELRADRTGGFDDLLFEGSAEDATHTNTSYTGLAFVFTSSVGAGKLWWDDVRITQSDGVSNEPPRLQFFPSSTDSIACVNQEIRFTVIATEPPNDAGDTITLKAVSAPAGTVFPAGTGPSPLSRDGSWMPSAPGLETIVFEASDQDGTNTATMTIQAIALDPTRVWINEFHYDNTGSDIHEGVEIAGPAGTDLSNYEVLLYNGADGRLYGRMVLSGCIDEETDGRGAVWFSRPNDGMQNGGPDGVALVRNDDTGTHLLQFLSYEGAFTAQDGPAAGLPSRDIGVAESANQPLEQSLQLTGRGDGPSDFSWTGPCAHSRGRLNDGQTITKPATVLVID